MCFHGQVYLHLPCADFVLRAGVFTGRVGRKPAALWGRAVGNRRVGGWREHTRVPPGREVALHGEPRRRLAREGALAYLTQSVSHVVLQKSTPPQIRQLQLCYHLHE